MQDRHTRYMEWLWQHFVESGNWPTRKDCIKHFGSRKVFLIYASQLDGNLVWEFKAYNDFHYELTLLGLLSLPGRERIQNAIVLVIEAIRQTYLQVEPRTEIDFRDILKANGMEDTAEDVSAVKSAFHGLIPSSSWSPFPTCSLTVDDNAEVLTDFDDLSEYVHEYATRNYYPGKKCLSEDNIASGLAYCAIPLEDVYKQVRVATWYRVKAPLGMHQCWNRCR